MNNKLYINSIFSNKNINICQNSKLLYNLNNLVFNNSMIISDYNNTKLLFYSIDNDIYQLSYNINEKNGLYINSKNFVQLNIDNYSLRTVNNKLYYNINSIPYSTNTFNGILYIDNDNIENNITVNNTYISKLSLYNNILTYYIDKLNSVKKNIKYYNDLQDKLKKYSNNITFSDEFFKENILEHTNEKLNDDSNNYQKTYIYYNNYNNSEENPNDYNFDEESINNETFYDYTCFSLHKLPIYNNKIKYISYLSLNNIKVQYRNLYYINNGLINSSYLDLFWQDVKYNDIIYCKSLNDIEFRIFTNYYDSKNPNIDYELNDKLIKENNIYLKFYSSYTKSNVSNIYTSDDYTTYTNYAINNINANINYNFQKTKKLELDIIPNINQFTYHYIDEIEHDIDNQYDIYKESLYVQNDITINYYTDSINKIILNYDNHENYSYVNIISIPQNTVYYMLYSSIENLDNKVINKYLFSLLSNKKCICKNTINKDYTYLFYTYNYVYDNKSNIYFKDYESLINKDITPMDYVILSNDILSEKYIIYNDLIYNRLSNIKFNNINHSQSLYVCNLQYNENNNTYKIIESKKIQI